MLFSNANYDTHLSLTMIDVCRDQLNISLLSCRYLFVDIYFLCRYTWNIIYYCHTKTAHDDLVALNLFLPQITLQNTKDRFYQAIKYMDMITMLVLCYIVVCYFRIPRNFSFIQYEVLLRGNIYRETRGL